MGTTYHYYVQLILNGKPPKKHSFLTSGRVGIDPGVSTEAVVSDNGCILVVLNPGDNAQAEIKRISRKLDRSMRSSNPDNYNPDGTIKPRRSRNRFVKSKTYKQTLMQLKTLRRRNTASLVQAENILANRILESHGSDIFVEKMNYKALQARSKETTINSKGRFNRKGRFGKSLGLHAPARFLCLLEQKLGYIGKSVTYVNTQAFKGSQYRHDTDTYEKVSLSARTKAIAGHTVQRDLYSAFLLRCAKDRNAPDRDLCIKNFDHFVKLHDECIHNLLTSSEHKLSSFGLDEFKYLVTD